MTPQHLLQVPEHTHIESFHTDHPPPTVHVNVEIDVSAEKTVESEIVEFLPPITSVPKKSKKVKECVVKSLVRVEEYSRRDVIIC